MLPLSKQRFERQQLKRKKTHGSSWEKMGRTADDANMTAAGAARLVRAVCTIEAMDRAGNVMIKDARGRMHTVGGVEMDKLDNVRLGDTVVVVFTEALVLSLKEI
jgi:hypothetical protein